MAGSIVQSKFNEAAAAATTIATGSFGSNVTANNWLWILVNGNVADTTTITQNSGTATIGSVTQQSSSIGPGPGIVDEWTSLTCQVTGTGSLDLLCTFGGSRSNRQILAFEITGVNAVDSGGGASQADGGTNPTPSLSITVGSQPAFCLAACVDYQGGTPGVGTGFTNAGTFGATVNFIRAQTKAITSTGATTGDFVNGGLDVNNSAMIVFDEPSTPTISAQPVQQTAASGATATFNTTTTGATSFQWQEQVSGAWTNVSTGTGGTSEDYTTATLSSADNGRQFRLQATNAAGTTNSAEVFLFISGQPITGKGRKGWGSAWWKRSVRKAGPISGLKLAELRKRPSRGPNFDNADFIAAWNDWFFPAASGGTHTTTGALAAQDATIAGTAAHSVLHATTGALTSQDATIAGTAAHATLHTSTGALAALAATVSGAAAHQHAATGALTAQDATIAGTAADEHSSTGALSAQAATIAGSAAHQHAATGALAAQASTLAGTAAHLTLHTSAGALSAQAATVSGTAQHQHAATGALSAQDATIAGSADHTAAGASHGTSGALAAQDATVAGSATHLALHTTTGALAAQDSTVSGSAAHQHAATGALAAQDATVAGSAAHLTLHTSTGALASQAATLAGSAAHEHAASGALASQDATISGAAAHTSVGTHDATGTLQVQDASISGSALLEELPGSGFPGFEVDQAPKLWWKRKPSSPDEPAAEKPEQPKPKKASKPSQEVKAQVRAAIAEAAKDQVKRGSVPKSARFAEVRSVLKPFGESADFNWPQLYERLYQQALTDALRQELELEATLLAQQQMRDEDDAIALLLLEA